MMRKTARIYYFSGTGNSFRVANWAKETIEAEGWDASIQPMDNPRSVPASLDLLGLVFPTHGFTAPWHVIYFALRLPRLTGTPVFVTPTRAGIKIGVYLPGMEGTAGYLLALILARKGCRIRGSIGIDMPSNWLSLHWGLNKANAAGIIDRAQPKTVGFVQKIMQGRRVFGGIIPLILGLLLAPISFLYLIKGRFFLAKLFFASYKCNGCGLCAEMCPTGSVTMKGGRPYWSLTCESCMRCMGFCPQQAVEASQPLAVMLSFIAGIPAGFYLLQSAGSLLPQADVLNVSWFKPVVNYLYFLISISVTYVIFDRLIKIPLINKLFTWTTFTHIYRRYHEPSTRVKDL